VAQKTPDGWLSSTGTLAHFSRLSGKEEANFHFNGRNFFYIVAVDEINDSLFEYLIDKIVNDENHARKLILK
jgi:hypothetical protein